MRGRAYNHLRQIAKFTPTTVPGVWTVRHRATDTLLGEIKLLWVPHKWWWVVVNESGELPFPRPSEGVHAMMKEVGIDG